jgi:hypothetical protein
VRDNEGNHEEGLLPFEMEFLSILGAINDSFLYERKETDSSVG